MNRWTRNVGILAVLASAGVAAAQSAKVEGSFDNPIVKKRTAVHPAGGGAAASGHSVTIMNRNDGDDTVELKIENGKIVSAKVNGKEVPSDRVRHADGGIEILDEKGEVIQKLGVGIAHGGEGGPGAWWATPQGQNDAVTAWRFAGGEGGGPFMFTPAQGVNPPKVMLGINMSPLDEGKAGELEIEAGDGILIEKVIEGLPAAKAGLKQGDVVVRISGKSPATQEKLRELLRTKSPGDKLKVTVLRDGDEKTLTIELAEYDAEQLGVQSVQGFAVEPPEGLGEFKFEGFAPGMEWDQKAHEEAMKGYEEAMKQFGRANQGGQAPRGMLFRQGTPGMGGQLAGINERMAEIDRRLSELDARLERLTKKLEKLVEERP
ncbi:MAG: S1C family serine protease [Phycisphaerales bacterium]